MARTQIPGVHISFFPPWSRKLFGFKRGAPWTGDVGKLSLPQLKACLALAEAAYDAYGTMGKVYYKGKNMPAVAVEVAKKVRKGAGVHGGVKPAERRRLRHEAAEASIAALKALIEAKAIA